jgi:hypothetical protein
VEVTVPFMIGSSIPVVTVIFLNNCVNAIFIGARSYSSIFLFVVESTTERIPSSLLGSIDGGDPVFTF